MFLAFLSFCKSAEQSAKASMKPLSTGDLVLLNTFWHFDDSSNTRLISALDDPKVTKLI
jgi:hypothetical protein